MSGDRLDLDAIEERAKAWGYPAEFDVPALVAEVRRLQYALRDVRNALGPDRICRCGEGAVDCGLREEAAEALSIAREALGT